ncbi:MAG: tetratricopeptide repeat protein [Bacteroidota bacterium]
MKVRQVSFMKFVGVSIIFILFSLLTYAIDQKELILKANKAYSVGSFAEAAELYSKVAEAGYEAPELYYNLGNAYFKMHDFAQAILWYERAKRLDPGNEDINFNLNVANTKISDKIEPLPELFYKRWFYGLVLLFPVDTWSTLALIILFAGLAGLVLFLVSRVMILRKIGFWSGVTLISVSLIFIFLAWSGNRYLTSTSYAVIFSPTITVKSSPDEKSTDLFVVHEGTKVILLDNISGWYEIRIANGSVGWLPVTAMVKI